MEKNIVMDSLGANDKRALRLNSPKQQPNMDAYKLPSRKGYGNDMPSNIPNAVNGSRYVYCTNAHGDAVNNLKK